MLVTLSEILKNAEERNIAVGAFNTPNLETLYAVIGAAEELHLPVIIQFAQCHEEWIPLTVIGPAMVKAAMEARVPVCVHLDHGETLDYLQKALQIGFTGIMYDGSALPYEENLENTKSAVAMAKKSGASVEAELGSMGRRESGAGDHTGEEDETKIYTDPAQAEEFVMSTGIDALACSFGTTHGIYLSKPKLDFQVIRKVRERTKGIPVVMHGGSGVSMEEYQKAIASGVRKINYFTYLDMAGGQAAAAYIKSVEKNDPLFFSKVIQEAGVAMKNHVKKAMKAFALVEE